MASLDIKRILYVGGLDPEVTTEILYNAFIPFGDIVEVNLPMNPTTGKSKGFGFVEYELAEDAHAAFENMNNGELFGKVLKVNFAQPAAVIREGSTRPVWAAADEWYSRNEASATVADTEGNKKEGSEE